MTPADFSVIIPAVNEAANIEAAIRSASLAGAAEVIVADGGSDDRTVMVSENAGAKVIACAMGRGVQQNAGADAAGGNVFLFLHADCLLSSSAIDQAAQAIAAGKGNWGAFGQRIVADGLKYRLLERGNRGRVKWIGVPFGDQAIFVCREAFFSIGGFANEPIMEDVILSRALRKMSWPILLPGPVSISPRRWQQNGVFRQTLRNLRLQLAFKLGRSPAELRQYYPNHSERR